jgi:hypothetical protein
MRVSMVSLCPRSTACLRSTHCSTKRAFMASKLSATGIGTAALASLLARDGYTADRVADRVGGLSGLPHFAPKAKRVIYLFQNGGPTHVDLFDYKPSLKQMHGQPVPQDYIGEKRFSTMTGNPSGKVMLAPVEPFKQYGQSGAWVSDFMPYTAGVVDDLCFIHSLHTEQVNHAPAIQFLLSGGEQPGRPTAGAWLSYGLGNDNDSLPSFCVMTSVSKGTSCGQIFYDFYWGSGFLPSKFQGVKFRGSSDPVLYLNNPDGVSRSMRRGWLDDIAQLNELKLAEYGDPEIATRIAQYEMAYKMQASVPELTDLSDESEATLALYGPQVKEPGTFAYNCLMARRLAERGVRFIQLYHRDWDHHGNLKADIKTKIEEVDRPAAALIRDLKQRGMLEDTLVVFGGEFGRTPMSQGGSGRDHNPKGFTYWLAGGGVKKGISYGETDDLGHEAVVDRHHVRDLHSTILHLRTLRHQQS